MAKTRVVSAPPTTEQRALIAAEEGLRGAIDNPIKEVSTTSGKKIPIPEYRGASYRRAKKVVELYLSTIAASGMIAGHIRVEDGTDYRMDWAAKILLDKLRSADQPAE